MGVHAWSHTMNSLFVEIIIYPTFLLGIACNSTPPLAHTNTFLMEELQEGTKKISYVSRCKELIGPRQDAFLLGIACNSTPPLTHTNTFLMEELQEGTKKN